MWKTMAGGVIAALVMLAAPNAANAASLDRSPLAAKIAVNDQATEFSDQRRRHVRRHHRPRYVRPYYRPYAYYPRPYYYRPAPYYARPYYRRPGVYFGYGF